MADNFNLVAIMSSDTLLIVDDEKDLLVGLQRLGGNVLNCTIETADSASKALTLLSTLNIGLVLSDIRMPGMSGMALLDEITAHHPATDVILMTAYGTIDQAVTALQKGATDFVTKPLHYDQLFHTLNKCFERRHLITKNQELEWQLKQRKRNCFIGTSPPLQQVLATITKLADLPVTVLITGESGTGKELAARTIHRSSNRAHNRMIGINCAALPESVLESELFGHKKGAFTGADKDYPGLFVAANQSTLFLDEIGEMALPLQARLLRVLQEREVRPIGDTDVRKIDTRVLASTNRNLEDMVARGEFREDLYFRLNEIPLTMPPLREMVEDIPFLVDHFLNNYCHDYDHAATSLSDKALELLCQAHWPGNIRQLQNVLKRVVLFGEETAIFSGELNRPDPIPLCSDSSLTELVRLDYKQAKQNVLSSFTNGYFSHLLHSTGGNISQAARLCGLERQSLQQLLKKYCISAEPFRNQ